MPDKSSIEWTDATWNPVTGCSHVSPGCMGPCYAEALTARFAGQPGWPEEHRPWTKQNAEHNVRLRPDRLAVPLGWRRPRMVFVNSMSDLFHELVPYEYIDQVFEVMATASQHTYQVLTKRPERMRDYMLASGGRQLEPLPNVWLGTSIESSRFTSRADALRETPAAVRFISAEPLMGSLYEHPRASLTVPVVDGELQLTGADLQRALRDTPDRRASLVLDGIDWLIVGGCSGGRQAPPMHPRWATELRDACLEENLRRDPNGLAGAGPAFFFKQWGSWEPDTGAGGEGVFLGAEGRAVDGMAYDAYPDCLAEPVYRMRYAGAAPKSGGRLLEGRTWDEMPGRA